jgi:hypothetical protein
MKKKEGLSSWSILLCIENFHMCFLNYDNKPPKREQLPSPTHNGENRLREVK